MTLVEEMVRNYFSGKKSGKKKNNWKGHEPYLVTKMKGWLFCLAYNI